MSDGLLERTIPARVHGTYLLRPPQGEPAGLVVGCHGYGETASDHMRSLSLLAGAERWLLCSVQGLHTFYKRSGDVVATWMTRHDREHAIADNTAYVGSVVTALEEEFPQVSGRLAYIGFSQGVAMAYRAAAGAGYSARALVAVAGDVPPEVSARDPLALPPTLIVAGRSDSWYGPDKMKAEVHGLRERGVDAHAFAFDGGHEWTDAVYERVGGFLTERFA